MTNKMIDRLKENISIIKRHNDTGIPVVSLTNRNKFEVQVIDEIIEDVSSIIEKMENQTLIYLPCKVGDTVYILEEKCKFSGKDNEPWNSCNQYWDNVFKNKMWGCAGKDEKGNLISCKKKEMTRYAKEIEYSLFLYSNSNIVFGKNLFLTKEAAEQKLKEMREANDRA